MACTARTRKCDNADQPGICFETLCNRKVVENDDFCFRHRSLRYSQRGYHNVEVKKHLSKEDQQIGLYKENQNFYIKLNEQYIKLKQYFTNQENTLEMEIDQTRQRIALLESRILDTHTELETKKSSSEIMSKSEKARLDREISDLTITQANMRTELRQRELTLERQKIRGTDCDQNIKKIDLLAIHNRDLIGQIGHKKKERREEENEREKGQEGERRVRLRVAPESKMEDEGDLG